MVEIINKIMELLKELLGLVEKIEPAVPEVPTEEPKEEEKPKAEYQIIMGVPTRQNSLKTLGYYAGEIDGKEGAGTRAAYKKLQAKYGLTQDGVYGEATETTLFAAVKNVQKLLGIKQSGIVDSATTAAIIKYQRSLGIVTDGVCGAGTYAYLSGAVANPWKSIKYFTAEEFACKCGGKYCNGFPVAIDMNLVRKLDAERAAMGRGCSVSSGVRCNQHNKDVGGVSNSKHKQGKAVDRSYGVYNSFGGYAYTYRITGTWYHSNI